MRVENTLDPVYWLQYAKRVTKGGEITSTDVEAIMQLVEEGDKAGLAAYIASLRKASKQEKFVALWKVSLLTKPKTHLGNILSNLSIQLLQSATDLMATSFDVIAALATKKRTITISPKTVGAKFKGATKGITLAKEYMKSGVFPAEFYKKYDISRQINFENKLLDKYVKTIFRALSGEDLIFRQAALSESIAQQAEVMAKNMKLKGTAYKAKVKELV